jgi:hypothetical protein
MRTQKKRIIPTPKLAPIAVPAWHTLKSSPLSPSQDFDAPDNPEKVA